MFVRPRNEFAVKTSRTMKKTTSIFTKTTKTEISRDKLGHLESGPYNKYTRPEIDKKLYVSSIFRLQVVGAKMQGC